MFVKNSPTIADTISSEGQTRRASIRYRHNLPQMAGGLFITDGGMETSLIFLQQVELPHFASFVLLTSSEGRQQLTRYYERFLALARQHGTGFVLDTATWRANPDWAQRLGFNLSRLKEVNTAAVDLCVQLREAWGGTTSRIVINGVIGPRGDGYKAGRMDPAQAAAYHAFQAGVFADSEVDMVTATTMNTVNEAIGITHVAQAHQLPCAISFTVETDGYLADGNSLRAAIELTDEATDGAPLYYMINCAHPAHFERSLQQGEKWVERILGVRANASSKSHADLDEATELDAGDPVALGEDYRRLKANFPTLRILGGCCGTDFRHIEQICLACG